MSAKPLYVSPDELSLDAPGPRLELECLAQSGHLDPIVVQLAGKFFHRRFFTMDEERRLTSANASSPRQQLLLIGVSGEAVDGVNSTANRNIFSEEPYMTCTIDNPPGNGARRSKSDEHHRRFSTP